MNTSLRATYLLDHAQNTLVLCTLICHIYINIQKAKRGRKKSPLVVEWKKLKKLFVVHISSTLFPTLNKLSQQHKQKPPKKKRTKTHKAFKQAHQQGTKAL